MAPSRPAGKSVIGLDIQPGFATAVQVRTGGDIAVDRAAGVALSPGMLRDGEVADVEALAEALRGLFQDHKLSKRVRLGVASQRILMRTVDLPALTDAKQIAAAVRFHAQDHIPMPLEQAVLEHHSLGFVDTEDGPRTRVVLVAARRDVVGRLHAAARQAGLRPVGIDLSAFAMVRALHQGEGGATLYVSVGGVTNLALAEGTTCVFTRVVAGGTEGPVPAPAPKPPKAPARSSSRAPRAAQTRTGRAAPAPKPRAVTTRLCPSCSMQKAPAQFIPGSDLCVDCR